MNATLQDLLSPQARRFLRALSERRRGISAFVAFVAILAVVIVLILPQWYAAESTLLPPTESSDNFSMVASLIQSNALNKIGLFSTQSPSDLFAEILKSRTLREDLIQRYGLQKRYKLKNLDLTLRELDHHVVVDVNKAGVIVVRVEDRDPALAADMTNHLVEELDRFNREIYNTRAKKVRKFLEERLTDVTHRLAVAESTLTSYERTNKVIASDKGEAVESVASVMAARMSLQVRRAYVSGYSREDSPALKQIDAELAAYEREISRLPALKQKGSRLALEAELQRRLFSLITAQYEDARVQEARDTPTITVLDVARKPIVRARPKRGVVVLGAVGAALALSLVWVWLSLRREAE
jgi:tyrosine-protein kinase Etk/Wzc